MSFFSPKVKINSRFRWHFPIRRLIKEKVLHQSKTFFCPVRHSYFQGRTSCVANRGQDLYGLLKHNSEGTGCSITAKSSVVLSQRLILLIINDLGKSMNIVALCSLMAWEGSWWYAHEKVTSKHLPTPPSLTARTVQSQLERSCDFPIALELTRQLPAMAHEFYTGSGHCSSQVKVCAWEMENSSHTFSSWPSYTTPNPVLRSADLCTPSQPTWGNLICCLWLV